MMPKATAPEIQTFLDNAVPNSLVRVNKVAGGQVWVTQEAGHAKSHPLGDACRSAIMALADATGYVATLSKIGIVPLTVTSNLSINFMCRPEPGKALLAKGTVLNGDSLSVLTEVSIYAEGDQETQIAMAMVTYAVPSSHIR